MLVDGVGNLFGGIPLVKDVYARIFDGYELENFTYSSINDLVNSVIRLNSSVIKAFDEGASSQDIASAVKNMVNAVGQVTGLPTRNLYNVVYGLIKRFSSESAYKIDEMFYQKNYQIDLEKALEDEDDDMASFLFGLLYNDRTGTGASATVHNELYDLYSKGLKVLPRTTPNTITYDGTEYTLTAEEKNAFSTSMRIVNAMLERLFSNTVYKTLTDEQKAEAIKYTYDLAYDNAMLEVFGIADGNNLIVMNAVGSDKLALLRVETKGITADKNEDGESISGTKRKKVIEAIRRLGVSTDQKLLMICSMGYSIKDGDIRGLTAEAAKRRLLRYILSMRGTTIEQKEALAKMCGFEVKKGRIIMKSA